MHHTAKHWEKC